MRTPLAASDAIALRIIAGELKGRRIPVADFPGLRPTADRVREALFSILAERVAGAALLDAYSGSGALGFEALSRGAGRVVFLEADRRVAASLRRTAAALGVQDRCRILVGRALELVRRGTVHGPFDLILADPPYGGGEAGSFLAPAGALLAPTGLLIVERPATEASLECPGAELESVRRAVYGSTRLEFFARPSP